MSKHARLATAATVAAILGAVIGVVTLVFVLGSHASYDPRSTEQGNTYLSLYVLLFGALVMLAVFVAFLWIGVEDWRERIPISPLYWPQLAVKGTLSTYMMMLGGDILDLLAHGLQPHWAFLYAPVVKLFQSILLLAVFVSFGWVLYVILEGRRERRRAREDGLIGSAIDLLRREVGRLTKRLREEETRGQVARNKAEIAFERATVSEGKLAETDARADTTSRNVDDQGQRLDVVEEVIEIKKTTKRGVRDADRIQ